MKYLIFLFSIVIFSSASGQENSRLITKEEPFYIITYQEVDGKIEGEYKETLKGGDKIKTIGKYEAGLKDGVWIYHDLSGKLIKEENYNKGNLDGIVLTYNREKLFQKENYRNGEKDGLTEKWNYHEKLIEKSTYEKGKLLSQYTYYGDGSLKSEEVIPKSKNKTYFLKQYYPSGDIKAISTKKDNEYIKTVNYFENGRIENIFERVEGELQMVKKYSENGQELPTGCGC